MLRRMLAFPTAVLPKSGVEVVCYTAVMKPVVCFTNEYVNIVERFHFDRAVEERIMKKEDWPAKP